MKKLQQYLLVHYLDIAVVSGPLLCTVGSAAFTDFQEEWFCTHWFWRNLILYPALLYKSLLSKYEVPKDVLFLV